MFDDDIGIGADEFGVMRCATAAAARHNLPAFPFRMFQADADDISRRLEADETSL